MSVNTKNKRKIIVGKNNYLWYVDDYDSPYHILHIVSNDKSLILSCPVKTETPYVISKGRYFQNQKTDGNWHRYLLPFRIHEIITPGFVSQVIVWATDNKNAVQVKWNGKEIPI